MTTEAQELAGKVREENIIASKLMITCAFKTKAGTPAEMKGALDFLAIVLDLRKEAMNYLADCEKAKFVLEEIIRQAKEPAPSETKNESEWEEI